MVFSFAPDDNTDKWVSTLIATLASLSGSSATGQEFEFIEHSGEQAAVDFLSARLIVVVLSQAYLDSGLVESVVEPFRSPQSGDRPPNRCN